MTRIKLPILVLASAFALTQPARNCAQTPPPASPQSGSAKQAADSARQAEQAAKDAQDAAGAAQAAASAKEAQTAAAAAAADAAAAKRATDPQEAAKYARQAAADAQKAAAAAATAQSLASLTSSPSAGCPAQSDPEPRVGTVQNKWPPQWRPQAGEDYFKLEYDVSNHRMKWFDYKHQGTSPGIEVTNGSVLPVVYSREKVLVHVACLHPTDTVSITTNDIALPEQGADIRGLTSPSTAAALAPTLDALGSAGAAGTALGTPGAGFGAPPALPTGAGSLFTPGSSKDGVTYQDAAIGISPDALALEAVVVIDNAKDALQSVLELEHGTESVPDSECAADSEPLPGSIDGLECNANQLIENLHSAETNVSERSLSGFNDYLARTQALVTQLNGFSNGVSLAGLPARAVALRQNFEAVIGVLTQINYLIQYDGQFSSNPVYWAPPGAPAAPQTQLTDDKPGTEKSTCGSLHTRLAQKTGAGLWYTAADKSTQQVIPADTALCRATELYAMEQFNNQFIQAFNKYDQNLPVRLMAFEKYFDLPDATMKALPAYLRTSIADARKTISAAGDLAKSQQANGPGAIAPQDVQNASAALSQKISKVAVDADRANADKSLGTDGKAAVSNFNNQIPAIVAQAHLATASLDLSSTNTDSIIQIGKMQDSLTDLMNGLIDDYDPKVNDWSQSLRIRLERLDHTVGEIFWNMNNLYEQSWVEETDALPPLTSNTIVRIGINVQRNYTPFTLTGGATVGTVAASSNSQPTASTSPGGGQQGGGQGGGQQSGGGKGSQSAGQSSSSQSASTSPSGATSTSGSNDFTVIMEVHRFANFNLVGGVMAIHAKNYSFATVPEYASFTPGTGVASVSGSTTSYIYSTYVTCPPNSMATSTTSGAVLINSSTTSSTLTPSPSPYYCIIQTQTASLQPAGMVGVAWFPWHRDYFPRDRGDKFQGRNWIPSFMAASAVTQLGSIFFGPNLEPFNGIDIFGGWATANVTGLAKGTSLNQVLLPVGSSGAAPTLNTATHVKGGISFGVGFDISTFLQLFGKAQGPSLP